MAKATSANQCRRASTEKIEEVLCLPTRSVSSRLHLQPPISLHLRAPTSCFTSSDDPPRAFLGPEGHEGALSPTRKKRAIRLHVRTIHNSVTSVAMLGTSCGLVFIFWIALFFFFCFFFFFLGNLDQFFAMDKFASVFVNRRLLFLFSGLGEQLSLAFIFLIAFFFFFG